MKDVNEMPDSWIDIRPSTVMVSPREWVSELSGFRGDLGKGLPDSLWNVREQAAHFVDTGEWLEFEP